MLRSRFLSGTVALLLAAAPASAQVSFTSSDLPIVLIETNGQEIPDDPRIRASMQIIDNGPGVRNRVTDPANDYDGLIDIEIRGNSSQQYPKKQYRLETVNDDGSNHNVSLLGFPEENDWILHAPYADKTLMRNALTYDLARRMGHYASRVRFCEVVLNGVYEGVYILMEKIKRDDNRVDINKLKPDEIAGDNLTGGYIIKIDQPDSEPGSGWVSTYPLPTPTAPTFSYQYDEPKADEIVPEQVAYIQNFMADFEAAVQSESSENPETGYPAYINLGSFVDFFLVNELTKNTDGYRLSSYLYKDKDSNDGRLYAGPVWDFNQGFGNNDYYDGNIPTGFQYTFVNEADDVPMPTWWPVIVETETFQTALRERWLELRSGAFHLDSLMNRIDATAALLAESRVRNFERWPILGEYVWPNGYVGQTYEEEVGFIKSWLQERVAFLDANIAMPGSSPPTPLPSGWTSADIGRVGAAGSAGYSNGTYTVRGGGDIWGDFDGFHYVSQTLVGDGLITARLSSLAGADPWAKAGLMIRDGAAGDAPHAMLIGTAGNGIHLQYRTQTGNETDWQAGPARTIPTWLRLQRTGSVLTGFGSDDGQTWTVVGSTTIAMGAEVSIGLVTTSTDYGDRLDLAISTFTDVSVSSIGGGALPPATAADIGSPPGVGTTAREGTTFSVTGGGDVWGDRDAFHYASWSLDGDGALTTRLQSVTSINGWAKAGLMIRDGIGPDAVQAFILGSPQNGVHLQYRPTPGSDIQWLVGDYAQAAPVWLRIRRLGANVISETSPDGAVWTPIGTIALTMGAQVRIGLAVTSSDLDNDGRTATAVFTDVALSSDGTGSDPVLPEGWTNQDIGNVTVEGRSTYADGVFWVNGGGDLYGDFDGFQYAYQTLPGDAVITARLDEMTGGHPWAKGGLMIRANTDGAAPYVSLTGTPERGVHVQYRTADGQEATWETGDYGQSTPVWLRLQRAANVVSAFTSFDGALWTPVSTASIPLPADALVGLVATATDYEGRNDFGQAIFSNVALGGTASLAPTPEAAHQQAAPPFEILSVFPNPTTDRTLIRLGVSQPGFYRVEIVDLLGRTIFEHTFREDAPAVRNIPVDLVGHSAGLYVLRVEQEGGAIVVSRVTVLR